MIHLSDDYLIGFTEGEGMFYVGVVSSKETKTGWQVIYFFKVSQNPIGLNVLKEFNKKLDCGYIKLNNRNNQKDKSLAFVVRDLSSIRKKIIPFFDNKLIIKKDAFLKFKKVINIVSKKGHLNRKGMKKILELSYSMNTRKRKVSKSVILKNYTIT